MAGNQIDKRHLARLLALQYLYTFFRSQNDKVEYGVFEPGTLLGLVEEKAYNQKLYQLIIEGVVKNSEKLDNIIKTYAKEWPLEQINLVSLVVLRMAIWEGFIAKINPVKVVINEAIDLEKQVGSKSTSEFINGVLGKILGQNIDLTQTK